MHLLNILMVLIRLTVIILLSVASPAMAQEGQGADIVRDSVVKLRDSGVDAVGSLRNAVEFRDCLGIRKSVQVYDQDEIWLVDARSSHLRPSDLSLINVRRFENGRWNLSSLDKLASDHVSDPSKETVVFVHGNQTDSRWSLTRGIQVYRNLFQCSYNRKPVRLVIWQWKADRACAGFVKDYYIKSDRSVRLGTTLALTLGEFHDRNVTVIGYSLGAQITLSAMQQNDPAHLTGVQGYRIALIAPALDCDFTTWATSFPTVGSLIDRIDIFYNSSDRVLKFHDLICERKFGCRYVSLQSFVQKQVMSLGHIHQFDVCNEVGRRHCLVRYSSSPTVQSGINRLISSGLERRARETVTSEQNEGGQAGPADNYLILDPAQGLDASLPSTRAYLLNPVVTP